MLDKLGARMREYWHRVALRGAHYSESYQQLDRFYWVRDPWGMATEREQFRFRATNRIIAEQIGPCGNILEIGCGEGYQSVRLLETCQNLVGIDVSARAVDRARARCPSARFITGDVFSKDFGHSLVVADLVVACEVLYYVADVAAALRRMEQLGRACLVTYYDGEAVRMRKHLNVVRVLGSEQFEFGDTRWHAAWWRPQS